MTAVSSTLPISGALSDALAQATGASTTVSSAGSGFRCRSFGPGSSPDPAAFHAAARTSPQAARPMRDPEEDSAPQPGVSGIPKEARKRSVCGLLVGGE